MKILKAYSFRLEPTKQQDMLLRQYVGSCRFVYNKALNLVEDLHKEDKPFPGYVTLAKILVSWKRDPETQWLKKTPSQGLQCAVENLANAYIRFFKKEADHPLFHKKGKNDTITFPDKKTVRVDEERCRISLPKLGEIRYRKSRALKGEVRQATVRYSCGKWYVSILTRQRISPLPSKGEILGIDLGVARFAAFSTGEHDGLTSPNLAGRFEKRLVRLHQNLSRKKKGSRNRTKAKLKLGKLYQRIANVRMDFLHKATTIISKNHAVVVVEDLKVQNMTKAGKGKKGLNKAILSMSWGEFRRQLEYKLSWNGGQLMRVPPAYTSQTCPVETCGHVSPDNRKTQKTFSCVKCGFTANADYVGALNVKRAGHARLACSSSTEEESQSKGSKLETRKGSFVLAGTTLATA